MSDAQSTLRLVPYGHESSAHGTLAAATGKLLLDTLGGITPDHVTEPIQDFDGSRAKTTRTMVYQVGVEDSFQQSQAYYQMLPIIYSIGLKGGITPVEQTASQGDMLWDFLPSLTGDNDPDSISIWLQDNITQVERKYLMAKMITEKFMIPQGQGKANYDVKVDYFARQNVIGSAQTGLSDPVTNTINSKLFRIYYDPLWANLGTTEITGFLREVEVQTMTGLHPDWNTGQEVYFDEHAEGTIDRVLALTFKRNADSQAIIAAALSSSGGPKTPGALRLEVEGSQIGTGENHKLTKDTFGYFDQYVGWAKEADGTMLDTVAFVAMKDPTSGKMIQDQVITDLASL